MKKILFLGIGLTLSYRPLFSQSLTPEQISADLRVFRESLEVFHPELDRYQTREEFLQRLNQLEESLDHPLEKREFFQKMLPVLASVKDGHLKWIVQGKDQYYPFVEDNLFPLKLHIEKKKVVVLGHFGEEKVPSLAKVTSINGQPIDQVISTLLSHSTFADGNSEGGKYYQLNRYFSAFYSNAFGVDRTYSVELEVNDEQVLLQLDGVKKEQIESVYLPEKTPFSFEVKDGGVGVLKINRFFTYPGEPDFKRFLKKTFKEIQNQSIQKLVLDIRGNEGGNEKLGIELYRYLALNPFEYYAKVTTRPNQSLAFETSTSRLFKLANSFSKKNSEASFFRFAPSQLQKPHATAFRGELVVLVDGQTFSVATELSARVKADGRATFLGEETAGGVALNSSGFFTIVTLPHSKIDLGIPRLGFHMANLPSTMDFKRGIVPDWQIVPTAEDKLSGTDPVMKKALELMR